MVGKGASGKNHLLERFKSRGFRQLISHTTRPMREGEEDGREYHFVSEDEFRRMVSGNEFVEFQEFNGNYYGTSVKEWEESDVVILAPQGVGNITRLGLRKNCFIIYVDIPESVRVERMSGRKGAGEVSSRIESDEAEFLNFTDFDLRITDPNF